MRLLIVAGFVLLVILVDVSRLYLGVHYLSDVLVGNLVGLGGVIFAIATTKSLTKI
jgi:membrane-associated phospholipid phosphatase